MHPGTLTRIATQFLQMACDGRVAEAFDRFVADGFRHHNPWFRGDAAALRDGMADNAARFPRKAIRIVRTVEGGDDVAVYSHVQHEPPERGYGVAHFFRFEGERIAELWDIGQEVPEDGVNGNGMF